MEIAGNFQRDWGKANRGNRLLPLAVTVLLHALALFALLQYEPARSALSQALPIMVSLITPQPVVEKPQVAPKPLPVKPVLQRAPEPPPIISSNTPAAVPALAPAPAPPAPVPVQAAPPPQAIAAVAPPPLIPPNFNADYLDNPAPVYPALSRRLGEQGKVILRVLVNAGGSADKIEFKTSSGSNRLDDAAAEAVKRWRFVPARQGDQAVAAWVLIPITFTLKG